MSLKREEFTLKTRIAAGFCLFLCIAAVLFLRLMYLSKSTETQTAAETQSGRVITLAKSRGTVYDRNLEPLVNATEKRMAVIFPELSDYSVLKEFFGEKTASEIMSSAEPYIIDTEGRILSGGGIYNYSVPQRFSESQPAAHIIGYLSDGKGAAGLEKALDNALSSGTKAVLHYSADGGGRLLISEKIYVEQKKSAETSPVLTIDKCIQEITETVLKKSLEKGAVAIIEPQSGEILAAASVPSFDPENLSAALSDENAPFVNRAFSAYPVGSVWKLIVAAAALENGISTERLYECTGEIKVGERIFKCHWHYGHGEIDMAEALRISCNPYFISLAEELGGEKILKTAKDLGFGSASELAPDYFSAGGNLPAESELLQSGTLANFAFGQGTLLASPLQLAAAYAAFCNGGFFTAPTLIKGYLSTEGVYSESDGYAKNPVLSTETAAVLKEMLINVVEEGSGALAKPRKGSAGGKTASAQTGIYLEDGSEIVHAWFVGFYPAENPQYVIAVFAEGMGSGADFAAPVFKKICDGISALK